MKFFKKLKEFWDKLGPGLVTGGSDDDPSGIATYSQAGAKYGVSLLWTALITYPLMYIIQEMCARIGIYCGMGLTGVLKKYYSKFLTWIFLSLAIPAIILNIAADIAGMSAVTNLLFPILPVVVVDFIIVFVIIILLVFYPYKKIAAILKYTCLVLFCYFIVPFLVKQDWGEVLYFTFIPEIKWDREFLYILVAIFGTTISPYLFFWQATMSCEENQHNGNSLKEEFKDMRLDVNVGMAFSNLAMYFIILATGSILFKNGITDINTVEDAAKALEPLAGEFAYIIFSIGVLGVGFLSIPVLAGCIGYMGAELFDWRSGLDKKWKEAKRFYATIIGSLLIGLIINLFGIDPIKSLIFTAVVYGVITPFLIAIILHICNSKEVMGEHTNNLVRNSLGIFATLLMGVAALVLILSYIT